MTSAPLTQSNLDVDKELQRAWDYECVERERADLEVDHRREAQTPKKQTRIIMDEDITW